MKSQVVLIFIALLSTHALAADWPQFRGPRRDGVSRETGLPKSWPAGGPKLLWTYADAGFGYSGPAVVGDRLYMCGGRGDSDVIFALDIKDAPKEIWSAKIGPLFTWKGNNWNMGPNATPTVDGERLYALGGNGDLVCMGIDGKEQWRADLPRDLGGEVNPIGGGAEKPTPLGWGYAWSPLVDGDRLIGVPGGPKGLLAAFDKTSGKVLWQSKDVVDQATYSSPLAVEIGGTRQYIQVTNSGVVGVGTDGKVLWSYVRDPAYDDVVIATPVFHDNHIFSTVGFQQGCDLIKVTGTGAAFKAEPVFSNKSVVNRDGGVVLVDGYLYGHDENRGWFCQEFTTGKNMWAEKSKLGRGSVTFADGHLYCCSEKGVIALVEATPKGWTEKSRFTLPKESQNRRNQGALWTHPVIANGRLYIRDQEYVFCFDLK